MIARLTQIFSWEDVWRFSQPLTTELPPDNLRPRYNAAPTDDLLIVRLDRNGKREAVRARWGLIPGWAKDASGAAKCINARAETADKLPSFRDAFAKRRCLVLASGFYEWQTSPTGEKQPYYVTLKNGGLLAFAGLWSSWTPRRGPAVETCTVITTTPNELISPLHNRMPAILAEQDHPMWLGEIQATAEELKALLRPCPSEDLQLRPADRRVGNPKIDVPELIKSSD